MCSYSNVYCMSIQSEEEELTMQKHVDSLVNVKTEKIDNYVEDYNTKGVHTESTAESNINENKEKCHKTNNSTTCADIKTHACELCDRKFFYPSELTAHKTSHTGEKPFKCFMCKWAFSQKYLLKRHIKIHEKGGTPITCKICDRNFTREGNLAMHLKSHTTDTEAETNFICDICGEKFHRKNLIIHMKKHKAMNYSCGICMRYFKYKGSYLGHLNSHTPQEPLVPYICDTCHTKFTLKNALINHMRIHTGEQPFSCDTCKQKFTFKVALVKHVCIDGERPYMRNIAEPNLEKLDIKKPVKIADKQNTCEVCHRKFRHNITLFNHMRQHTGEKPFSCDRCHQKFTYKVALVKHICVDGERPYMRKIGEPKIEKMDTEEPVRVDDMQNTCEICHAQFIHNINLLNHMRQHTGEKPFKCDTCNQKFAYKVALVKHVCVNGEQPYMRLSNENMSPCVAETTIPRIAHEKLVKVEEIKIENEIKSEEIEIDEMECSKGTADIKIESIKTEIEEGV